MVVQHKDRVESDMGKGVDELWASAWQPKPHRGKSSAYQVAYRFTNGSTAGQGGSGATGALHRSFIHWWAAVRFVLFLSKNTSKKMNFLGQHVAEEEIKGVPDKVGELQSTGPF